MTPVSFSGIRRVGNGLNPGGMMDADRRAEARWDRQDHPPRRGRRSERKATLADNSPLSGFGQFLQKFPPVRRLLRLFGV